jgi:glycine hydroxymethyltransferase
MGLSGNKAEKLLDKVGITCNKNTIPGDTRPPTQASGIRLGTPAVTTRGFTTDDCRVVAGYIADVLEAPDDEVRSGRIEKAVREMMRSFPLPGVRELA